MWSGRERQRARRRRPVTWAQRSLQMKNTGDALAPGTRLEQFVIERFLGLGGLGVTYLARDESLGVWRALKEYLPDVWGVRRADGTVGPRVEAYAEDYSWGLDQFLREARILAQLESRHIRHVVRVYQVFPALGTAYMAMEYVEGRTLEAEVESEGSLSEERVRGLLGALTEGLSAVHAEGILHRDITPRNVMIRDDGTPVLIDFGAARQATGNRSGDVRQFLTPPFAPLEQYVTRARRGSSAALKLRQGPWTDIYALGAVTYWALSRPEHREKLDEAPARQVADELPPLFEAAGHGVSESLSVAVSRALAVHAEDRPQSLEEWRELLEGPAVPVRRPARVGVVDARQATEPSPSRKAEPPPPRWRDWRRGAASAGLAAVVLLVALFAFRNGGVSGPEGPTVEVADLEARLGRPVSALASDDNGWTDLHYAAALNLPGLAERLVGEQASVDARAYADREPFTDDLQARLQALGVTMDFDDFTRRGQTPLQVAAYGGAFDVVMTLLGQGADVHMRDSIGHTSLHQAAYGNAEEIVVALLEHGANVDARNDAGWTPLHGAAYLNAVGALVELLERGADIHATDDRGNTPLFRAYLFSGWTAREAIAACGKSR